jgi:alkylation response protein AidB-like acyl-CoA dehydrogenase
MVERDESGDDVVGMLELSARPSAPAAHALRAQVRAFLQDEQGEGRWSPHCDAWMSAPDPEFSKRLASHGWVGMTVPTVYGGHGRSALERFVVAEELLAAGAPVAAHWFADRQMAPAIQRHGSEEQKRHYLPAIARGECYFAIGMSEPDAGSDLAAVRTQAREVSAGWEISGTKMWTTGAHFAHALVLLARTSSAEADRHAGLSQFVVDLPWPGIEIRPIMSIDGEHHFNEVVFDQAIVPPESLLGRLGDGWRQVTAELAHERSGPERLMSTVPLINSWAEAIRAAGGGDPVARRDLGRLTAAAWTLHQMSYAVAGALADGSSPAVEAALVKDLGSQFEREVVETIRRHVPEPPRRHSTGLEGLLGESLLHSPVFTLRGGSTEILRSVVAKALGAR